MKNISTLSDMELLTRIKTLAQEERKLTVEVLHYLREVESRRLYAARAYSSLHEFCVKELGYSSGAAFRRIASMRLLKDVPEAEAKILSGDLNLSVLSQIHTYVSYEKKNNNPVSLKEKRKLVECSIGKSAREVQKDILELAPGLAPKFREAVIVLPENKNALKIIADAELMKLLEEVRTLGGVPGEEMGQIMKRLARFYIAKKTRSGRPKKSERTPKPTNQLDVEANSIIEGRSKCNSRYISKPEALKTRQRANHQCEYKDPETKKRCLNKQALQIDHIQPFAKGGASTSENLQLLCPAHNKFKAIQDYGPEKMAAYLGK